MDISYQVCDQVNQIVPTYKQSENVCVNQNFQNVLPNQKCESVSFITNVSHSANQQREPPKHYRTHCFRVISVTIFLHNVAVLLECEDCARKLGILQ